MVFIDLFERLRDGRPGPGPLSVSPFFGAPQNRALPTVNSPTSQSPMANVFLLERARLSFFDKDACSPFLIFIANVDVTGVV